MRINEYTSIEEFKSQYTGTWSPSDGYWAGLDFSYKGSEYRMQTAPMYAEEETVFPDEEQPAFYLYKKIGDMEAEESIKSKTYKFIDGCASMDELLMSRAIDGELFETVIMDDSTELLGQD